MLPNFDSGITRLARAPANLAYRHARAAKAFRDAFYHSLLRNYGTALLNSPRSIRHPAYKGDPADTMATVRTEVKGLRVKRCPSFQSAQNRRWLEGLDVVIGVFLRQELRTDFRAEIQQKVSMKVINRLEAEGRYRQQRRDRHRQV